MKNYAIILAGGNGIRSGLEIPKQFVKIAGKSVIEHTLYVFQNNNWIDEIIIVTHPEYIAFVEDLVSRNNFTKVVNIAESGSSRQDSSFNGLMAIQDEDAKVLIHDAVRPFITDNIINKCITALDKYKAVDVAIPSADTIIKVNNENIIENIPKRKFLRRGQTPQAFDLRTIKKAHILAKQHGNSSVTDDCGLILEFKLADVYVVDGDDSNIKITYPIDITIADKLFQLRTVDGYAGDLSALKDKVTVVFGGSRGIGAAIVSTAKQHGANVYSYSRTNGVNISNIKSIENALKIVYEKEGRIDYIINTAGILKYGALSTRSISDVEEEISTNYTGSINVALASFKYLKETKGAILFYSSSSYTRGRKYYSVYSSTKAAVVNLTQALADEWDEYGIKVNVIVPERTATPMRYENFGEEPPESLLSPDIVALTSLNILPTQITGQVITVNKHQFN